MLAIVIPYYKLLFFEATLQSLANQIDKRFTVYIGDDASPENPETLLKKYIGKFDFRYHRFESNLGGTSLVKQWKRCIALTAAEEWLMILGDDDFLEETVIAAWYKRHETFQNKTNVVRFATKIINENSGTISPSFQHPEYETAGDSWFRKFKGKTRSSLSEHVFSRESYLKYGFIDYPLAWHSDDRAWMDFSSGKFIYTINESNIFIRVSNGSISGKNDNDDLKKKASLQFFENCISQKLQLFTKPQRLELLYGYELAIKRVRKINLKEWFILSEMYFKNFNVLVLIKFGRRIYRSIFNL